MAETQKYNIACEGINTGFHLISVYIYQLST